MNIVQVDGKYYTANNIACKVGDEVIGKDGEIHEITEENITEFQGCEVLLHYIGPPPEVKST